MIASNREIAAMLEELADLREIEGAGPFRVRAYRNAARFIAGHPRGMADLVAEGADLAKLPGIGRAIAEKIRSIVETGKLPQLDEAKKRTPEALARLLHVRGLGPKRIKTLNEALEIRSVEDLKRALRAGRVGRLAGFGAKTERLIEQGLATITASERRMPLLAARRVAEPLTDYLRAIAGVRKVTVAGSYRRARDTVGDLDILVACAKGASVMPKFPAYEDVERVVSRGDTRSTVILSCGLQVDLRVVPAASYGAALQYFTGSKDHNVALRSLAARSGLKINEYGVFEGARRVAGRNEKEVYAALGLPYIEPELRENRGEIEAARAGRLPRLLTLNRIRGDLHCHSEASDGEMSLRALAVAARAHGYDYVAVADQATRVDAAKRLDAKGLRRQMSAIDRLNGRLHGLVLLKSAEVAILEDGSLDLPDEVLAELDLTVCAIHAQLDLPRKKQTDRLLRAMDHPHCNVLVHSGGRLPDERDPFHIDPERIMQAAKERGCCLELDAQPSRLDRFAAHGRLAKEIGVKVSISTDARRATDLDLMELGIGQGRRAWLEAEDVVNTRSLKALRPLLKRS